MLETLGTQLALLLEEPQVRKNLRPLAKFIVLLVVVVALYSVLFHVLTSTVEGEEHSWLSGVYWTLVTMSTLGFGDITFHSDIGRGFSLLVLFSGVILILVVMPFVFIRYFFAPSLEAPGTSWRASKPPSGVSTARVRSKKRCSRTGWGIEVTDSTGPGVRSPRLVTGLTSV